MVCAPPSLNATPSLHRATRRNKDIYTNTTWFRQDNGSGGVGALAKAMRLSPKERKKRGCDELDISRTSPELAHRTGLSYGIGYERGSDWDWGGCRGGVHCSFIQSYCSHSGSIISSTRRII